MSGIMKAVLLPAPAWLTTNRPVFTLSKLLSRNALSAAPSGVALAWHCSQRQLKKPRLISPFRFTTHPLPHSPEPSCQRGVKQFARLGRLGRLARLAHLRRLRHLSPWSPDSHPA